jgi:anthranilate phosphoribosyltransferase
MTTLSHTKQTTQNPFDFMSAVMRGAYTTPELLEFLGKLEDHPPSGAVLNEYLRAIRESAVYTINAKEFTKPVVDIAGTGGDGMRTVNISTLAALIAASTGLVAAIKYGNRSASGVCGSMDVLEELGIAIDLPKEKVSESLARFGFSALFARSVYPGARFVGDARKQFGRPTLFNLLFPLARPVLGDVRFVFGCATEEQMDTVEKVQCAYGVSRCLIVRGFDGTDEVSVTGVGKTAYKLVLGNSVVTGVLDSNEHGVSPVALADLQIHTREEAVARFRQALDTSYDVPETRAFRTAAVMNAAVLLCIALGNDPRDDDVLANSLRIAREALESEKTLALVNSLQEFSGSIA